MSIEWILSSSGLILLVLLVRFFLRKKISPCLWYTLWLVVALRLLCPFSVSGTAISILNLLPGQDMAENDEILQSEAEVFGMIAQTDRTEYDVIPQAGRTEYDMTPQAGRTEYDMTQQTDRTEYDMMSQAGQTAHDAAPQTASEKPDIEQSSETQNAEMSKSIANTEKDGAKEPSKTERSFFPIGEKIEIGRVLRFLWLLGAGICGGIFLTVNLDYSRRLQRSRKRIEAQNLPVMSIIPVYETQMIQSPCLFGLFSPAVYVTEETLKEETTFRFVLCHENTHYWQHDHWWAFMRIICLCIHWFNPLVWLAFRLSRQDGEMACDERALRMLGDTVRVGYGRTLLKLSAEKASYINGWRISTTMSGSGRQMKERLWMIVNKPGGRIGIQSLVLILFVLFSVITFTGKSMAREKEESESAQTAGSAETKPLAEMEKLTEAESLTEKENLTEALTEAELLAQKEKSAETEVSADTETQGHTEGLSETEFDRETIPVSMSETEYEFWRENRLEDAGDILEVDLNFDGRNDLCIQASQTDSVNTPYYCMLWDDENKQYEYSMMLYNVEVDAKQQWISERKQERDNQYSVTYYRYDEDDRLHMVRYVEADNASDAIFERFDLTYVEDDDSIYMLPAIVDETEIHRTLIAMAKQSLTELYQWTGEKVDTACFQVSNMGGVYFGMTPEDIEHSRTFYDRQFGADTEYNLSDYEKSISSMYVLSGRSVWYSPVLWKVFPEQIEEMTDEEIIIWYLERVPLVENCKVKSIEKRYEDMWTVQTEDGLWFEVVYDAGLKEAGYVVGPYPDYPMH